MFVQKKYVKIKPQKVPTFVSADISMAVVFYVENTNVGTIFGRGDYCQFAKMVLMLTKLNWDINVELLHL